MNTKKNLLFLCTGNSCRSQMAHGWANHFLSDTVVACSAGIETHGLNPHALHVMQEAGIDISTHQSQHVDEFKDISFDLVVTVCDHAHEHCPLLPGGGRVVHVGFEDPPKLATAVKEKGGSKAEQLDCYRRVRDQIKEFVQTELIKLL